MKGYFKLGPDLLMVAMRVGNYLEVVSLFALGWIFFAEKIGFVEGLLIAFLLLIYRAEYRSSHSRSVVEAAIKVKKKVGDDKIESKDYGVNGVFENIDEPLNKIELKSFLEGGCYFIGGALASMCAHLYASCFKECTEMDALNHIENVVSSGLPIVVTIVFVLSTIVYHSASKVRRSYLSMRYLNKE